MMKWTLNCATLLVILASAAVVRADTGADFKCTLSTKKGAPDQTPKDSVQNGTLDEKIRADGVLKLHDSRTTIGTTHRYYDFSYSPKTATATLEMDGAIRVSSKLVAGGVLRVSYSNDYDNLESVSIECRRGGVTEINAVSAVRCSAAAVTASDEIGGAPSSVPYEPCTLKVKAFVKSVESWQFLGELKFGDQPYNLSISNPSDLGVWIGEDSEHMVYTGGGTLIFRGDEIRIRTFKGGGNYNDLICGAE